MTRLQRKAKIKALLETRGKIARIEVEKRSDGKRRIMNASLHKNGLARLSHDLVLVNEHNAGVRSVALEGLKHIKCGSYEADFS